MVPWWWMPVEFVELICFCLDFAFFFSRRWTGSSWWWRRTANCFTYLTTPPSIWAIQWLVNTFSFLIAVNSVAFIFPPKLRRSENPSFQHRMMAPLKMTNFGTQFQNYFDRNAWKNRQFDTRLNRFHFFRFENFTHGQIDQFWNPFPPISTHFHQYWLKCLEKSSIWY